MTFVKDNAPLTTMATMEAIFGSSYFGVGRGLGGLFGGLSIEAFGDVTSFRYVCRIIELVCLVGEKNSSSETSQAAVWRTQKAYFITSIEFETNFWE